MNIKRLIQLIFVITLFTFNTAFSAENIEKFKIANDVYMFDDLGSNSIYIKTKDGNILIDSGKIENLQKLTSRVDNVKYLLNTHWHADHTGGNVYFGKKNTQIIAHKNTLLYLSRDNFHSVFNKSTKKLDKEGLPTKVFSKNYKLKVDNLNFELIYIPKAHTNGDFITIIKEKNIIDMKDLSFSTNYPFIDVEHEGSIDGVLNAMKVVLQKSNNSTLIVPGHGRVLSKKDLERNFKIFSEIRNSVKKYKDAGKSLEEVQALNITKDYDKEFNGFINGNFFISTIYKSLK